MARLLRITNSASTFTTSASVANSIGNDVWCMFHTGAGASGCAVFRLGGSVSGSVLFPVALSPLSTWAAPAAINTGVGVFVGAGSGGSALVMVNANAGG